MIENVLHGIPPGTACLWLAGIFFIGCLLRKAQVSAEIARLGSRAPRVPFRVPYGLSTGSRIMKRDVDAITAIDFIIATIKASKRNQDAEFWGQAIRNAGSASNLTFTPQTAEVDAGISNRIVLTSDPENIKALLTGQFADYGKGEAFHEEWRAFLGDSIFVTDGELWSRSRQLLRPMFTRDRIVDTEIFEKHVQHLIPLLAGSDTPGASRIVDVGPLFFRYTLDAATDYLLGHGTNSLQNPETKFAEAFRYVQHRQAQLFRLGSFNFFLSRKEFHKQLHVMNAFIQPYIERVLSLSTSELDQKLSSHKETFLDALARFTRDPRILRDQLVAVLLAGRDTTAGTLSFCLFELSRNPEIVKRLREEIHTRVGVGPSARKPSYTDLKEMKFLNAVLNETMRFYPVVPFNVRHALRPTTLPRGGGSDGRSPVGVREGTRVIYSTLLLQRDPRHYTAVPGDENEGGKYFDPGLWLPQRWVEGWQPKPWFFIPFNGGPRICIGQQFAMIEMAYTVVRILQAFETITAVPPTGEDRVRDPSLEFEVTLSPGSELNCVFGSPCPNSHVK